MSNLINCSRCDKEFKISVQRLKKNRNNYFCSKGCEGEYRKDNCSTKVVTKCTTCSKEIKLKKSQYKKRNKSGKITCSRKCMGELRKKIYIGKNNPNCKYKALPNDFF